MITYHFYNLGLIRSQHVETDDPWLNNSNTGNSCSTANEQNPFQTYPFGCNTESTFGTCMSRFKTEHELLQHIVDMSHDKHHCLTGAQTKTWAEHEHREVTQQVTNAAKASASRTHALWANARAHEVSAGSDQQDMKELGNNQSTRDVDSAKQDRMQLAKETLETSNKPNVACASASNNSAHSRPSHATKLEISRKEKAEALTREILASSQLNSEDE